MRLLVYIQKMAPKTGTKRKAPARASTRNPKPAAAAAAAAPVADAAIAEHTAKAKALVTAAKAVLRETQRKKRRVDDTQKMQDLADELADKAIRFREHFQPKVFYFFAPFCNDNRDVIWWDSTESTREVEDWMRANSMSLIRRNVSLPEQVTVTAFKQMDWEFSLRAGRNRRYKPHKYKVHTVTSLAKLKARLAESDRYAHSHTFEERGRDVTDEPDARSDSDATSDSDGDDDNDSD
jgi:hypothetical protein